MALRTSLERTTPASMAAIATGTFFINREFFPWLVPDPAVRVSRPFLFEKFDLESEHVYYYVVLLATALVIGSVWSLRHSRTGRALVASRDNPRAAQSYGVSPIRAQLTAFAVAGFLAAFAGGIFFYHQHDLSRTLLEPEASLRIFSVAVIGGLGVAGAAVPFVLVHLASFGRLCAGHDNRSCATQPKRIAL